MARQAAHTGHTGHAHQLPAAAIAHRGNEGLEGVDQALHIGRHDLGEHRQVVGLGQVQPEADAGIGHHDVGQAHVGNASLRHRLHGRGVAHVE